MAKRRRSAAQRAATARMLAAKRHRNPSPRRHHTYHRRAVRRNPTPFRSYRRRRNPSGGNGLFDQLLTKEGMLSIAAIAATPTVCELGVTYLMPSATGMTRSLVKAAIGAGLAWGVYKFASQKAGVTVGMVSVGTLLSEAYANYMGSSSLPSATTTQGYIQRTTTAARPTMKGYGYPSREPGLVYL